MLRLGFANKVQSQAKTHSPRGANFMSTFHLISPMPKHRSGRPRTSFRAGIAIGVMSLSAAIVFPSLAAAAVRSHTGLTPLQKGLKYYRGKTLTLVSDVSVGGAGDLYNRVIAPAMGQYLHATINVENISAGNGIAGQDQVAASTPNGLMFVNNTATTNMSYVLENTKGVNFNLEREAFIGATPGSTTMLVSSPSSPITTFEQLLTLPTAASPATFCTNSSGTALLTIELLVRAFNIPARLVTGFPTPAALLQGFEQGDCELTSQPLSTLTSLLSGHQARPLASPVAPTRANPLYSYAQGVPTFAQEVAKHSAKAHLAKASQQVLLSILKNSIYVTFAPSKTPIDELDALRAAFQWAQTNKGINYSTMKAGFGGGFISATAAKQNYVDGLASLKPYISLLGLSATPSV